MCNAISLWFKFAFPWWLIATVWIFVSHPPYICWSSNPQGDGIRRWGFLKMIRSWDQGIRGINILIKEVWESSLALSPCENTAKRPSTDQKLVPHQTSNQPNLKTYQPLELWERYIFLCLSYLVYVTYLLQPQKTKILMMLTIFSFAICISFLRKRLFVSLVHVLNRLPEVFFRLFVCLIL